MKRIHTSSTSFQDYYSEIFAESYQDSTDIVIFFTGIKFSDLIFINVSIIYTCSSELFKTTYKESVNNFIQEQLRFQYLFTQKDFFTTTKVLFVKQNITNQVDMLPPQVYYSLHGSYPSFKKGHALDGIQIVNMHLS